MQEDDDEETEAEAEAEVEAEETEAVEMKAVEKGEKAVEVEVAVAERRWRRRWLRCARTKGAQRTWSTYTPSNPTSFTAFSIVSTITPSRRREFCHSAAPPSPFSRCFNMDEKGVSVKWHSRRRLITPCQYAVDGHLTDRRERRCLSRSAVLAEETHKVKHLVVEHTRRRQCLIRGSRRQRQCLTSQRS